MTAHDARALLYPRNIALVGVSDRTGHWSGRIRDNLTRFGFPGAVYPVNPRREEIWGQPCFPSVDALPEAPDHVVSFVPAEAVFEVMEAAAGAGARSALVFAGGFGEGNNAEGRARAARLKEIVERTGLALCGPNCLGNVCAPSRAVTLPDDGLERLEPGPVAVIAQSGGLCVALNRILSERGLMPSYLISCGNQVGLAAADYIRAIAAEDQIRSILLYLEQVVRCDDFLAACRNARAAGKTVVAVKIGGSDAGRAAALAHTGALAGSVDAFDAVAGAAGVVRLDSLDDAIEALEYTVRLSPPKTETVAVMTNSGALKSLVSESAARARVPLAEFADPTQARLTKALGPEAPPGNPVDTKVTIRTEAYTACLDALADDPGIGLILLGEELPLVPGIARKEANLRGIGAWTRARAARPPVALFTPVNVRPTEHARALRAELAHLPYFTEPDRAMRVIARILDAGARARRAGDTGAQTDAAKDRDEVLSGTAAGALNEAQSKALLARYGLPCAKEEIAADGNDAVAAARRLGFPVVVKALSADLPHKTEAGAIALGLVDEQAVRDACETIVTNIARHAPDAHLEGFVVARQVSGGIELALGLARDPEMGPVVMFGAGGVMLELYKDVAFGRPGLNAAEAEAMIDATHAARLLAGWRGAGPFDRGAVVGALVALGRFAAEAGAAIEAVDVNPLVALPVGAGAVALDALVVLNSSTD